MGSVAVGLDPVTARFASANETMGAEPHFIDDQHRGRGGADGERHFGNSGGTGRCGVRRQPAPRLGVLLAHERRVRHRPGNSHRRHEPRHRRRAASRNGRESGRLESLCGHFRIRQWHDHPWTKTDATRDSSRTGTHGRHKRPLRRRRSAAEFRDQFLPTINSDTTNLSPPRVSHIVRKNAAAGGWTTTTRTGRSGFQARTPPFRAGFKVGICRIATWP